MTGHEAKQSRFAAARDTHESRHLAGGDLRIRWRERVDQTACGDVLLRRRLDLDQRLS
jgi:hypothetical protein